MSDQISTLLSRIAALESKLSAAQSAPTQPAFDPVAFRNAFIADPVGTMSKMGVPKEHVTRVLVADAMGDQAPPELKVLAQQGPQISATRALESQLEQLSRQVSDIANSSVKKSTRESFSALASDKTKYPHLAKAFAADPTLFDEDLDAPGADASALADRLEKKQAKFAAAFGVKSEAPPASANTAETTGQSTQAKPANGGPPPIPSSTTSGLWTEAEHQRVKEEILRKYPSQ